MTATRYPPSTGPGSTWAQTVADTLAQLASFASVPLTGVAGTNTITASSVAMPLTSLVAGMKFTLVPAAGNTGAVTLNIDGLGAIALKDAGGSALASGRLQTSIIEHVYYNGTEFRLLTAQLATGLTVKRGIFTLQKTSGNDGGSVTGLARTRYPLNTTIENTIPGLSIDTVTNVGRLTLPAGTFEIEADCSFYGVGRALVVLRDITNGADLTSGFVRKSSRSEDNARLYGNITLASSISAELQYFAAASQSGNGLGFNVDDPGLPEQFGFLRIETRT